MKEKALKIEVYTVGGLLFLQTLFAGNVEGKRHDEALSGHESPHSHEESRTSLPTGLRGFDERYTSASGSQYIFTVAPSLHQSVDEERKGDD